MLSQMNEGRGKTGVAAAALVWSWGSTEGMGSVWGWRCHKLVITAGNGTCRALTPSQL